MKNDSGKLAIKFLGIVSIVLSIGFVICVLAILNYNTYFKYSSDNKKIEVQTEKMNSNLTVYNQVK